MIERFGAPTSFQRTEFQELSKQTMRKRYGVDYAQQSPTIMEKSKQTMRKRYGVERPLQNRLVLEKMIQTNQDQHGGIGLSSPLLKLKAQRTIHERYGVDHISHIPGVIESATQTQQERYGGVGMASAIIAGKIKSTLLKRYGVDNPAKSGLLQGKDTVYVSEDLIGYADDGKWVCKCPHPECTKCTEKQYIIKRQIKYDRERLGVEVCTILNPQNAYTSSLELHIQKILDVAGVEYQTHNRSLIGQELDIYIPSKNIAIECNGCYWHSTKHNKDPKRHLNKYLLCAAHGIQLLTLWEDWIHNTPDIVESLVLSKLGIYKKRIGARQCKIKYVKSCSQFVRANHIQGPSKSSIHLVLEYQNQVVAAMEFSKRSKTSGGQKDDCWELTRFCTKLHWQIIGAASKLLKQFIKDYQPNKIVSFSSNDISVGNVYDCLGFESDSTSTLAYWYITPNMKRYHRTNFMKKRLVAAGEDPTKTEFEIMDTKPIFRIYDSGHIKHTLIL